MQRVGCRVHVESVRRVDEVEDEACQASGGGALGGRGRRLRDVLRPRGAIEVEREVVMRTSFAILLPVAVIAAVGCASYPAPTQGLADAQAAQRSAQELGAAGQPAAQLHLRLAEEQITRAKAAIDGGDNERASLLLARAKSDAELALALAREQGATADAQRATDHLNTLRSMNASQGAQP